MTLLMRRPILLGGLGLTLGVWLLESLHPVATDLGGTVIWGAVALGLGIWWLKQQTQVTQPRSFSAAPVDRTQVEKALAIVETRINQLTAELNLPTEQPSSVIANLRQQLAQLTTDLERREVRLSVMGGKAVGKTSLRQLLQAQATHANAISVQQTTTADPAQASATELEVADLVLFVTTGDLTDSEFQAIQQLVTQKYRVLLVFNKQDQYLPSDRSVILQQIRERIQEQVPIEDIVAIATNPASVKVRQYLPDGSVQEHLEQPSPDLAALQERLSQILTSQSRQLIFATVLRQSQALNRAVQEELNRLRRARALPLIEQYQWIAAATAFANPVPSLDLLATAAINTQLVVDLGAIYQQKFSLEQAKTVAGNLASQMVKLGLVEMASQAIAPLLKSNALTYVAGGLLQGVSAAYLTRLAGLSLVEYFEEQSQLLDRSSESPFQVDRLIQKLKAVFQDNQRTAFLQTLVKQAISRLTPQLANAGELKAGV